MSFKGWIAPCPVMDAMRLSSFTIEGLTPPVPDHLFWTR